MLKRAETLMNEAGVGDFPLAAAVRLCRNRITLTDLGAKGVELYMKNDWDRSLELVDAILEDFRFSYSCGLARLVKISSTDELLRLTKRLHTVLCAGRYATEAGVKTDHA